MVASLAACGGSSSGGSTSGDAANTGDSANTIPLLRAAPMT